MYIYTAVQNKLIAKDTMDHTNSLPNLPVAYPSEETKNIFLFLDKSTESNYATPRMV